MTADAGAIVVEHVGGDRLRIQVRGHEVFTDQPAGDGGEDTAPTPTELFVAGLAACIAFYAQRFLRRHGLKTAGLVVTCGYEWAESPHRVGEIELAVDAPGLVPEKRAAFMRVIEHCTVHNTLQRPPIVRIRLAAVATAVA